jgi:hypothetical protein
MTFPIIFAHSQQSLSLKEGKEMPIAVIKN